MITEPFENKILTESAVLKTKLNILKAAAKEFAEQGYDAASIREIATTAKVTHSSITYHFGNKEDLFETVLNNLFKATFEIAASFNIDCDTKDVSKAFEAYLLQIAIFYYEHPEFLWIINREGSHKNASLKVIAKELKKLKILVRKHLKVGQDLGAFKKIPVNDLQLLFSGAFQAIFINSDSDLFDLSKTKAERKLKKHVKYIVQLLKA